MFRILGKSFLVFLFGLVFSFSFFHEVRADRLDDLRQQIEQYTKQLDQLQQQASTLANQISQFNAQIALTELKIDQTQEQILLLGGRIDQLTDSLSDLSMAFSRRAIETYRMSRSSRLGLILLTSDSVNEAVSKFYYLKRIQAADQDLLSRLQHAQTTYESQKGELEELDKVLGVQKEQLDNQKLAKSRLLSVTKNDEKKFQELLAAARAEFEAIQAIIAGKGDEVEVGGISAGDRIASIIPTASACSSGGHLHFEVAKGGYNENPANYLSAKSVIWDNKPDGEFSFNGPWPWPINDPVRITQGYGMTYFAAQLRYYGGSPHTGIDMVNESKDWTVKSVKPGILYRGAIGCGGGTLRYVRVKHNDDNIDTYYLHVSY